MPGEEDEVRFALTSEAGLNDGLAFPFVYAGVFLTTAGIASWGAQWLAWEVVGKIVIGVGVKNSTSDLLIANCDEFIYYDDLVRDSEKPRRTRRKSTAKKANAKKATSKKPAAENAEEEHKRQGAIDLVMETVEDLFEERGEEEKVWGSMVKQALKRRQPGFSETYHGFRNFGQLLEEARDRELLELEHDEKSGGYIIRGYSHDEE